MCARMQAHLDCHVAAQAARGRRALQGCRVEEGRAHQRGPKLADPLHIGAVEVLASDDDHRATKHRTGVGREGGEGDRQPIDDLHAHIHGYGYEMATPGAVRACMCAC